MDKRIILTAICCFGLFCGKGENKDAAIIVEGKVITRKQVEEAADMIHQSMISMFPTKAFEGISPELLKGAARQLIANELLLKEADRRKLSFDSMMVDSAFKQFKSRFGDEAIFKRELAAMGQTEEGIKGEMQKGALVDTLLKTVLKDIDSIKEEDCKAFYEENRSRYLNLPKSRVSQIFFSSDTSTVMREKKRAEAQKVLDQIRAGADFAKTAAKFSGGDIGWFKQGDLKPELDTIIAKLKTGEVSDLVPTEAGFHILKKTDEEPGKPLTFDEVKDRIRISLELRKKNEFVTSYIDKLISEADVRYKDTSLVYVPPVDSGKK
ncbi:MAG TPA: peptidyl-prolyl cis-trans isomerase [Chitinispirillaceae bacterium]|nr:peptidyl-prolyl cis-trans isomerase [Chitinispirillaceae bacterium]